MQNYFVEFLLSRKRISPSGAERLEKWLRHTPQPIGMIAMSHGLLTGHAIDEILHRQSETGELFGEIAVKMAHLTQAQVDHLLDVQRFRRYTTAVEGLALSGRLPIEEATALFSDFLRTETVTGGLPA